MKLTPITPVALTLALCALPAHGGDWTAYETSEHGWSTHYSCEDDKEKDTTLCWTLTRGHNAKGKHTSNIYYMCWGDGDEKLGVRFQWGKGKATTASEPVLSARWDGGAEVALETVSESRRRTKFGSQWMYFYVVKPERSQAFLHALDEHDTLDVLLPYTKVKPKWATFRLQNAIPSIAATMGACGIEQSSLGTLPV